jgi:hypothetical protein
MACFSQYFLVEKENKFLIGPKRLFILSFEHWKKSKQMLHNIWWKIIGRFVFGKFVKTCRELDINHAWSKISKVGIR